MRVELLTRWEDLESLRSSWDELAQGISFRTWAWASAWWREFGCAWALTGRRCGLFVLSVHDGDRHIGLAPWYRVPTAVHGRVLRFLGSDPGESVCSDYLGVLSQAGREQEVAEALADWLSHPSQRSSWDLLEFMNVDSDDRATSGLATALAARGCLADRRAGPGCWRIDLPETWDAYLARLSKSHRKQLRRAQRRYFDTRLVETELVEAACQLDPALDTLVDLHQRRRASRGQTGCFDVPSFGRFLKQASQDFLEQGRLRLVLLKLSGQPAAAEYQITGDDVVYAYQSGINPDLVEHNPGQLAHMATIRAAINEGRRGFDFLRGDERYKPHWRATKRASVDVRIVSQRMAARFRHSMWSAAVEAKQLVKRGLQIAGTGDGQMARR